MNRTRAVALAVAALLVVAALVGYRVTRPDPKPRWAGPALATDRGTATEVGIEALSPAGPGAIAARLLGVPEAEAGVQVTPGSPITVHAERAADPGPAPAEAAALATAKRAMTAYGMVPAEWTFRTVATKPPSVVAAVSGELPAFPFKGVTTPQVTVRVDAKGVRAFTITPVRLHPRAVPIVSQREAFGRLTKPGRYVGVRLVLANATADAFRPYWEFASDKRDRRPVLAVLTP